MSQERHILVTGAAGFIGYHMVKRLLNEGFRVLGLDNLNDYYDVQLKLDRLKQLGIHQDEMEDLQFYLSDDGQFTFVKADLENPDVWEKMKRDYRITDVIHLAAQAGVRYSIENPRAYVSSNVMGFMNVLEFCRERSIAKLIYASSSSVYGMNSQQPFNETESCDEPVSLYAATKRSNELMAGTYHHLFGIESVGLRFFTVYGPWGRPDMAPMLFTKAAFEDAPIKVFNNGDQSRDFTYVDDIISGVYQVFRNQERILGADVCNIGNGSPVRLMDFIESIEKHTKKNLKKEFKPAQPGDVVTTFANTDRIRSKYGWATAKTDLDSGVSEVVKWYRAYHNLKD